jgi:hypothetical protein
MKKIINYGGLRLRPNFNELITYLETDQPRKSLPSRAATTLRNLPQFTQLDGDTLTDLTDIQTRLQKEQLRNILLKEHATQTGISMAEATAQTETKDFYDDLSSRSDTPSAALSHMSSPVRHRIDTPLQTRAHTPLTSPFRTHLDEAQHAEEMIQGNVEAELARQLASLDLGSQAQAATAASSYVQNVVDRTRRKLNFDDVKESPKKNSPMSELNRQFEKLEIQTPGDKQKKIAQKHLGDENKPTEQFIQMMDKASTARGSNDPPPRPPTTMDISKDANYWNTKSKPYIWEQIKISGFDPPYPVDINKIKKSELLDQLFKLRRIIDDPEMERLRPKAGRPKKGTESTKRKYAKK